MLMRRAAARIVSMRIPQTAATLLLRLIEWLFFRYPGTAFGLQFLAHLFDFAENAEQVSA
jgi:hypothetical protein